MRILAIAALAVLALAAPAQARKPPRMTFHLATSIAESYWAKRGVLVPCDPQPKLLGQAETASWNFTPDMLADVAVCTVDVTPWAEAWRTMPGERWYYCREVVHEVGHLAGLEHDYGGVMAPGENVTPWGCSHPRKFQRAQRNRYRPAFRIRASTPRDSGS